MKLNRHTVSERKRENQINKWIKLKQSVNEMKKSIWKTHGTPNGSFSTVFSCWNFFILFSFFQTFIYFLGQILFSCAFLSVGDHLSLSRFRYLFHMMCFVSVFEHQTILYMCSKWFMFGKRCSTHNVHIYRLHNVFNVCLDALGWEKGRKERFLNRMIETELCLIFHRFYSFFFIYKFSSVAVTVKTDVHLRILFDVSVNESMGSLYLYTFETYGRMLGQYLNQ